MNLCFLSCVHWYLDPLVARAKEGLSTDIDHITYMRKLLELIISSEDALHDLHPEYTDVLYILVFCWSTLYIHVQMYFYKTHFCW